MPVKPVKLIAFLLAVLSLGASAACSRSPVIRQAVTSSSEPSFNETDALDMEYKIGTTDIDLGDVTTIVDESGEPYVTPSYNMTDRTVSLLSHWDASTPDSIHMVNYIRKYGGPQIEFVTAPYGDCGTKLQAMVLADNSPDIYKVRDGDTANLMRQGMFTDLTGLINWDNRNWRDLKPYLDTVTYDGKILIAPEFNSNYFVWFNRSVFDEHSTEDPLSLYEKGEWTLDNFDNLCRRLTIRSNGAIQTYGFGYDHTWMRQVFSFFDAQLHVKHGDTYENTINSDATADAVSYLNKEINVWKVTCAREKALPYFAGGKLAMLWYGNWLSMSTPFAEMNLNGAIDFVPAPENTASGLGPRQDFALAGHAIPVGAKNTDAAVTFIEIFNFYKQTPELDTVSTQTQCEINNWSYEQFRRMRIPRYYKNKYTFIDLSDTWGYILDSVETGQPWLSVRDIYSKQIDLAIEGIENSGK